MPIKSTVAGSSRNDKNYPALYISSAGSVILLLHEEKCGVVVGYRQGTSVHAQSWPIGTYRANWDMGALIPFKGQVTLEEA